MTTTRLQDNVTSLPDDVAWSLAMAEMDKRERELAAAKRLDKESRNGNR